MEAKQWKMCKIVIERDLLPPAVLIVTFLTAVPKLPFMRVMLLVAGHTGHGEFIFVNITCVASVTFRLCMLAALLEFGLFVVVEADHIPFLRPMAGFAFVAIPSAMHIL